MNHDNFTEVTSEDAPKYLPHYDRTLWAQGYNTCLERTNAAELLQFLIQAKTQIEILMFQIGCSPKEINEDYKLLQIENAIKKATDESR